MENRHKSICKPSVEPGWSLTHVIPPMQTHTPNLNFMKQEGSKGIVMQHYIYLHVKRFSQNVRKTLS